jgi:hypothetical protein
VLVELSSRGGQPRLGFAHLLEQPDAQLVLQLAHLLEYRGLGQWVREWACCRRNTAGARHPVEAFQTRDLHR